MRPIAYLLAILLIVVVSAIVFFLSSWFLPTPIDSTQEWLVLAGAVITAVLAGLAAFKNIVEWIDKFFIGLSSGGIGIGRNYKQKYLQHLFYRHRNFDVKGLTTQGTYTLELARVFVELSIAPRPPHEMTANPIQLPHELHQGRHTIWDFLAQAAQHFAIIGPPGSGKTTLLKHMALVLGNKKAREQYRTQDKLPVLLFLRDHVQAIIDETEDQPYSLEEAIQQDLRRWDKAALVGWFQMQLDKGRCLVMLDGLDEVADAEQRRQVVAWVERKMQAHSQNRFIVTSRPHGYRSNPLGGVTVLEVRSFDSEQQQRFIENWYLANEIQSQRKDDEGVRIDAAEGAADLRRRLRGAPKLADLAVNPLLLTMIATVHKYRSSLPGRRVELYAEICEVFLGKRRKAIGLSTALTPAQRQRVLQPLAWHMMAKRLSEVDAERAAWVIKPVLLAVDRRIVPMAFLKSIEEESGLLLERESGEYAFAHLTFQEYLAAAHAQDQQLLDDLLSHVAESWWHETLLLYAAQADAAPIIEACLSGDGLPDVKALLLAMACVEEAREVRPDVQQRLDNLLDETLAGDDVERIRLVSEARLRRRLQRLVPLNETVTIDTSLITCAEYQLFLDEMRAQGKYYQPDHWQFYHYPAGEGNRPVTGVRPSDAVAFCGWLSANDEGTVVYRLPQPFEVSQVTMDQGGKKGTFAYWMRAGNSFAVAMVQRERPAIATAKLEGYLDRARARTGDRARASTLDFDRALALDHALALDRALDFDRARALAHARALDRALDLDLDLDRARARDLALVRALDFARALELDRDRALDFARARARDLAHAHDLDLALVRDLDFARARALDRDRARDLVRNSALMVVAAFLFLIQEMEEKVIWATRRQQNYRQWQREMEQLAEAYIGLFVDLCILEERIKGNLPAFEGIRLVGEVKT